MWQTAAPPAVISPVSPTALLAFAVAFIAITVLIRTVYRRRPFPDGHPRFRRCRYILAGLLTGCATSVPLPQSPKCPECGADLTSPKNVLHSRPVGARAVIAFTVLLAALIATQSDLVHSLEWMRLRYQ